MADSLNTGLSPQQVLTAFDRALNDYTDAEIDALLGEKQDSIADLSEIRSGAAAGATAVQQTEFETDQARQDDLESEDRAALIGQVDGGAKNIVNLNTDFTTHTNKGITYTNNGDGTIKVSGTSNASDSYVTLFDVNDNSFFGIQKGETVVIQSTSDVVSVNLIYKKSGGGYGLTVYGYKNSPARFTVPSDFAGFLLRIAVPRNGTTVDESVGAMICTASDYTISPAFVPYAPTNRELYETKADASDLHALLPDITSATTIHAYVDSLSKGVYTAFIANVSNPSDSPIDANCFVNIYVYSATTAAVELIPISSNELTRTYTMRKISGTWREWYKFEGTVVS